MGPSTCYSDYGSRHKWHWRGIAEPKRARPLGDSAATAHREGGRVWVQQYHAGQTLHIHGTGFLPDGTIVLKLDTGLVLTPLNTAGKAERSTEAESAKAVPI